MGGNTALSCSEGVCAGGRRCSHGEKAAPSCSAGHAYVLSELHVPRVITDAFKSLPPSPLSGLSVGTGREERRSPAGTGRVLEGCGKHGAAGEGGLRAERSSWISAAAAGVGGRSRAERRSSPPAPGRPGGGIPGSCRCALLHGVRFPEPLREEWRKRGVFLLILSSVLFWKSEVLFLLPFSFFSSFFFFRGWGIENKASS